MKDALRRIGVFRSDEAGDDGSEWCVTFEPRGEEPIGTLDDALAEVERVTYSDGARDERKRLQSALDALAVAVKPLQDDVAWLDAEWKNEGREPLLFYNVHRDGMHELLSAITALLDGRTTT